MIVARTTSGRRSARWLQPTPGRARPASTILLSHEPGFRGFRMSSLMGEQGGAHRALTPQQSGFLSPVHVSLTSGAV